MATLPGNGEVTLGGEPEDVSKGKPFEKKDKGEKDDKSEKGESDKDEKKEEFLERLRGKSERKEAESMLRPAGPYMERAPGPYMEHR